MIALFRFLDEDCKGLISRNNAWKYIYNIINATKNNIIDNKDLYVNFIRYCFERELYSEGFSILELIQGYIDTKQYILYKAMYLSALDRHQENILLCKENIAICEEKNSYYYNLKLISLASYRSLHILAECEKIHNELLHDREFKKLKEYGFFLRLSEMYLDRRKSMKLLKKSVEFFEKNDDTIQAGKSLISYAFVLSTQGKLNIAKKQIEKAEVYLSKKRMGSHMFLVNKAAIQLYSGDYSERVWETLNESEITAVVPFDKLAIIFAFSYSSFISAKNSIFFSSLVIYIDLHL